MEQAGPLERAARTPQVEILELKDDFIKFVLSGCETSFANALRRVMIGEVPTMAIDLVTIEENSSVLHDEFVAHRLGLIPIRVNSSKGVDQFAYKHECFCESNCPNCSIEFELDVINDDPNEPVRIVASSDLRTNNESVEAVTYSSTEEDYFSHETQGNNMRSSGITIVKLGPGQHIKCHCVALKGISKMHAKWCPVSVATFAYEPEIQLNDTAIEDLTDKQKQEFVDSCPTRVFKLDEHSGKISVENKMACMFCDECVKLGDSWRNTVEDENVVSIKQVPNKYIFSVETNGALKPDEVVFSAIRQLQMKLSTLLEKVHEIQQRNGAEVTFPPDQGGFEDTGGFI